MSPREVAISFERGEAEDFAFEQEERVSMAAEGEGEPSFIDFAPAFLDVEDPPIEWVIPELAPRGAIVLPHADPRTMKTLGAEEIAVAAVTATPAFGMERFRPPRRFKVLYCSQEDAAPLVRTRVKGFLKARGVTGPWPNTLAFAIYKGITFDTAEWRERFYHEVTALGFEMVIIDPIRAFTEHADKGPADVMPVAKFLRTLTVQGVCVVLVHHDVKPPANGPDTRRRSHRASGGGWFSVSECPISFEKIVEGKSLVVPEDFKFSADPAPFTITYNETSDGAIRLIGETTTSDEGASMAIDEAVLGYLTETPGASGRAIAKALRKGYEPVSDALERLLAAGRADCVELGPGRGKKWTVRSVGAPAL